MRKVSGILAVAAILGCVSRAALASTYVVYIPLDSPIYEELDTLNSLGYLDTYLDEIKPISRVEAARLVLEAQSLLSGSETPDAVARTIVDDLRDQLRDEVGWLDSNAEDNQPTMFQPVERLEAQAIYSRGQQRFWNSTTGGFELVAKEGTPLFPYNDGIPTASGTNEVVRWESWAGLGGFLTGYGEAAATGPLTRTPTGTSRFRALDAEAVMSLGNYAISFGQEEMNWGVGHFGGLAQSNNATPFPALRVQLIHPKLLPWIFRYLGQFRFQVFLGQLDGDRVYSHPYIAGQIVSFKPVPNFEIGFNHAIDFGGKGNDNYGWTGFIGRVTGLNTGSTSQGNTNSRGGIYLKFRFPSVRGLMVYQEIVGEDNLTKEVRPIGGALPFLAVSYQGGFYLPRLTQDGRTDVRFEYAILEPQYSVHSDSLYWTYSNNLMGDAMGPNASEIDLQVGRWFTNLTKASADVFVTERAPNIGDGSYVRKFYGPNLSKERSLGFAFDLLTIPESPALRTDVLSFGRAHLSFEYVNHMNYGPSGSIRGVLALTIGIKPRWSPLSWK